MQFVSSPGTCGTSTVGILFPSLFFGLIIMVLMSSPLAASPQKLMPTSIPSTFLLKPIVVSVDRGGTVDFLVQIVAPYGGEGKFEISRAPSFGTLDDGERVDSNTRRFRYVNRGALYSQQDSFDFRVKAPNHAWSTYSATITIRDVPPSIIVTPECLDFGQVAINSAKRMTVLLSNSYGALLSGRIQVRQPWSVLGSDSVSLKQQESCQFNIQFAPVDARSYTGEVKLIPENPAMPLILTSGRGLAPFQILAKNLIVSSDHPEAVIMVSNSIANPLTISWSGDPVLDYPNPITIPPMGMVDLKTVAKRIRLADDEKRDCQTRLVADHYSESIGVVAVGPKGRLSLEPSSRGSQLAVVDGHPLSVEGVIRNTSASSHSVQLVLTNPRESNSQPVSQAINVKERSSIPFLLSWESVNPPPKILKLRMREGDKEIASYTWNVFSGSSQSVDPEPMIATHTIITDAPESQGVRVATSAERENLVILQPPRFEEGWLGRRLVLCWLYYGNVDPGFVVREHMGGNSLMNRTGEEERPWRKLGSLSKRIRMDSDGKWEVSLPLPMPGFHQYMVTTSSAGEKLVASQNIQISWKMYSWPYLRILILIAVALIVIRAIRERM
jgi:hypothetical protein